MPHVLWGQVNDVPISTETGSASTNIAMIVFRGDLGLLLPDVESQPEEAKGCILSTAASSRLLGSDNPVGSIVVIDGLACEVVASVRSDDAFVVMPGDQASTSFTRITTLESDGEGFFVDARTLESVLPVRAEILNYRTLTFVSYLALLTYPVMLILGLFGICIKARKEGGASNMSKMLYLAPPSLAVIALTLSFSKSLSNFGGYFPNRWSDFEGWIGAFHTIADDVWRFALAPLTVFDTAGVCAFFQTMLFSLLSLFFLLFAIQQFGNWNRLKHARHAEDKVK
ncbi:ABC transporter permease [Eggerthella lenta]|uniref:ABC transporter permease n=1 Tax=Eggerthella lenta TaxID=84112 RepID=UPI000DF84460|nr:ABC transporter permease [Eggerthella lenta]RDC08416.1 hypothetical protein C1863_00355 [Eggerthella lenta]